MSKIKANGITINYEQQGAGEPLVLIPYLTADNACYAFQVADYAKRFTCISLDPRGAGQTDKPAGTYSMELFADDVAAFMQAIGVERAHVSGVSLGAATGLWLAGKYPQRVKSLSLHSCWPKTDPFLKVVVEGWRSIAKALDVPATLLGKTKGSRIVIHVNGERVIDRSVAEVESAWRSAIPQIMNPS